jgi:cell division septum initiation protein DivIVA
VELSSSDPLRQAHFAEKPHGFDPDEVNAFLTELAEAVDRVLARLRAAESGTGGAAASHGEVVAGEGVVGRALVLAQRTADQLVAEAEELARAVREHAEEDANRIRRAAVRESESMIEELERRRQGLEQQLADLDRWGVQRRDSLRQMLSEGLRGLDNWLDAPPPARSSTWSLGL